LNNFITRTLTGAGIVSIIIAGIVIHPYVFFAVFLGITIAGLWEFYRLSLKENAKPQKILGTFVGAMLFAACFFHAFFAMPFKWMLLLIPFSALIFISELFRKNERPFTNLAFTFLGVIYLGVPFALFNYLVFDATKANQFNFEILLGFFILQWISDTGAYLVGSQIGRRKLFERISPKKSWEGSIGGAVLCLAAAWALSLYFSSLGQIHWIVVSILIVIFGTLGDLVESLFKRSIQVKDSGSILPGHGGILDRFDAVLISAPVVYAYIELFAKNS
jgi:phosphatidate cytidylyltransferase